MLVVIWNYVYDARIYEYQTISIWNKEELSEEWKESIIVPVYTKGDKKDCSNYRRISILPNTYKLLCNILLSRSSPYAEEITGDHELGFDSAGQLLIIYSPFVKYLRRNGNTTKQCISCVYTSRQLMIQLGGKSLIFSLSFLSP